MSTEHAVMELGSEDPARGEGGTRSRLDLPRPRARQAITIGGHNYSSFVGAMKIMLPAIAVGIVLLVVAWPQFRAHEEGFHIGLSSITPDDVQNLRMVSPRYQGTDRRGEPFTVTAESATKKNPASDVIELEHPMADITITAGNWLALKARYGVYREQDQQLDLIGAVDLYHDDGYEFETLAAHVDLVNNTAEGDDPVHGQGPFGDIRSEGFRIYDKGARILFTGKATLLMRPHSEGGSDVSNLLPVPSPGPPKPASPRR